MQEPTKDETEARFARVFAVCPDFITITCRATGRYLEVNDAFTRIMGYEKAEVIGRTALDIGIWETPNERQRVLKALLASARLENFLVRIRRKNGEVIDALLSVDATILEGGRQPLSDSVGGGTGLSKGECPPSWRILWSRDIKNCNIRLRICDGSSTAERVATGKRLRR